MKHEVYLILGTNIEPEMNTKQAINLLSQHCKISKISSTWETVAVGSSGPNFLNTAVLVETSLNADNLKLNILAKIEQKLGRVRTSDKNAPRTIDLDIVIFDDVLIDPALWKKAFIAIPMAELIPALKHPQNNQKLIDFIRQFEGQKLAFPHPLHLEEIS